MIRPFAATSVLALMLAGCSPADEVSEGPVVETPAAEEAVAGTEAAPEEAPAEAPAAEPDGFQLSYSVEAENYTVSSEIDPAIPAFDPALAWQLWDQTKSSLDDLARQADDDRRSAEEYATETGEKSWFMGYSMDVQHKTSLVLEDVIGLTKTISVFTGGAHPNYFTGGSIYRKGEAEPVATVEIIADAGAFTSLVVAALAEEKIRRGVEEANRTAISANLSEILAPTADYPDVFANRLTLIGSTEAGKAGGLRVLFSPYDVGAYAEGTYEVVIPAAGLAPLLTPDWADRFGGAPAGPK